MSADHTRAAIKAAETLIKYNVQTSPVSPLPILERIDNVLVASFAELDERSEFNYHKLIPAFGMGRDAFTSIHPGPVYVVAYNSLLPDGMIRGALARELGHIILGHEKNTEENAAEALTFAIHFLCPRPLVHAVEALCIKVTDGIIADLTGVHSLYSVRRIPGTEVPAKLNKFIRNQFMPFIANFFTVYQTTPKDFSAVADLGTFMDCYAE